MTMLEQDVRRTDIMPSLEAQREASEIRRARGITVNLAPQQFVLVGDESNNVIVRKTVGPKVYGKEAHDGVVVIAGLMRLRGKRNFYQVEIGDAGVVEIRGGEQCGQNRDIIISKPSGVSLKTDGRVIPESLKF